MPTPAYIDTDLYLPVGGVNGFELNGHAVNGAGFVDSPFAGAIFTLDPYRSILPMGRFNVELGPVYPSLLPDELDLSTQVPAEDPSEVWAFRGLTEVGSERSASSMAAQEVSMELEVESVSMVPAEYRTAYVLASHPASVTSTRAASDVDELPPSTNPSEEHVSTVPAEDRSTKVRRI
jgi:hypothetical protein